MTTSIAAILATWPILMTLGLLALSAWRDRRRNATIARQIQLTDALGDELGAIMAPVVTKPFFRPWRAKIQVPVGHPRIVGRIVAIAHDTLIQTGTSPYELVLTPGTAPMRRLNVVARRRRWREAA
jgi:hypothetical protein